MKHSRLRRQERKAKNFIRMVDQVDEVSDRRKKRGHSQAVEAARNARFNTVYCDSVLSQQERWS